MQAIADSQRSVGVARSSVQCPDGATYLPLQEGREDQGTLGDQQGTHESLDRSLL